MANGICAQDYHNARLKEAEALKLEGNDLFKQHLYVLASFKYLKAISLVGDDKEYYTQKSVYLCNNAFCNLKLENYGLAIRDAAEAIEINPSFSKSYYRRGCAQFCLGHFKEALRDFEKVCQLNGNADKVAVSRLNECKKQLRAKAFAEAIRTEKSMLLSQMLIAKGLNNIMPIDVSYKGLVYNDRKDLTDEFLKELMVSLKTNRLHPQCAYRLVLDMIECLQRLPSLVYVDVPEDGTLTVCGDIHGQYFDLVTIFEMNGLPNDKQAYIFNGDFVDRGAFSVEVVLFLFACKLAYPNAFHLVRGNHETEEMNEIYGFKGEVLAKYDEQLYQLCNECFHHLPLAYVIEKKIFVVHGGLSRQENLMLEDIERIDRNKSHGDDSLMTDLLWSDPSEEPGRTQSKRGIACQFGPDVTSEFLTDNNLSLVIRSHELRQTGYSQEHDGKLITVFSAPNYCDQMGNQGAFIKFRKDLEPNFIQFSAAQHPPTRPMQYANPILGMM